jgi:hypothetical protein
MANPIVSKFRSVKQSFRKQRALRLLASSVAVAGLFAGSLVTSSAPAFATGGTFTWTGTACTGGTPNCNWSNTSNWQGGAAPLATDAPGDILIFNNAVIGAANGSPTDDITGLSVATISFINNGAAKDIILSHPLTITSDITQAAGVTTTDSLRNGSTGQAINLGGNVTVNATQGISLGSFGSSSDSVNLGGHSLTFNETSGQTTAGISAIYSVITGSGTVTYNSPYTNFQLYGNNTYSGTTNVIQSSLWVGSFTVNTNAFGSSTINVATGGAIEFQYNTNTTISNPIVITGVTSGVSNITSMDVTCDTGCSSATTVTIPNITLNGSTRFGAGDPNLSINLTGITSNGFCIEYLDGTTTRSTFTGGPSGCLVAGAPGLPNTGGLARSLPIALALGGLLSVAAIEVGRRVYIKR